MHQAAARLVAEARASEWFKNYGEQQIRSGDDGKLPGACDPGVERVKHSENKDNARTICRRTKFKAIHLPLVINNRSLSNFTSRKRKSSVINGRI